MSSDKDKAVKEAISGIEKQFGEGSIVSLGQRVGKPVPCIPTGIHSVDYDVLGIGGFPRGRMCEVLGPESSGKTTLTLHAVAEAQRAGGRAAFVDMEHALDPSWMSKIGCKVDDIIVSQPDNGEQALEIAKQLVESGAFDIVVVDSVAALVPKAELDGEMGDSFMGLHARLMSQATRKLTPGLKASNCALVFINQIREKIGVMFGSPETSPGGRALRFYASVRLDVRRISSIKDGDLAIGNKVKIKSVKNKMFAPFRETEVDLMFERGFDGVGSLLDTAVERKLVDKSGAWYSYKGERLGQGRNGAIAAITERKLIEEIRKGVTSV